jgi:signal transduction histidine kinase
MSDIAAANNPPSSVEEAERSKQIQSCQAIMAKQVRIAHLILSWLLLTPMVTLGKSLYAGEGTHSLGRLVSFLMLCLVHLAWSNYWFHKLFAYVSKENVIGRAAVGCWDIGGFLGIELLLAILCTLLAGKYNPWEQQVWLWLPGMVLSVLVLPWMWTIAVAGFSICFYIGHLEYTGSGGDWHVHTAGAILFFSLISTCTAAVAQSEKWRLQLMTLTEELQWANTRMELQSGELVELAATNERYRVAREVHDTVGNCLTVVGVQLEVAQSLLPDHPEQAVEAIRKAQQSTSTGLQEMRASVSALRSSLPENQCLLVALNLLADRIRRPDLEIVISSTGEPRHLPPNLEVTLYRCVQEALTNVIRHSNAIEVKVSWIIDLTL